MVAAPPPSPLYIPPQPPGWVAGHWVGGRALAAIETENMCNCDVCLNSMCGCVSEAYENVAATANDVIETWWTFLHYGGSLRKREET